MFSWLKFRKLDARMRARIEACRELVANTKTVPAMLHGKEYPVEVLVIPAWSEKGKLKTPRLIFPGGGTDLFLCIEPALYSDRETIIISPLGYGKSADIPDEIFQDDPLHMAAVIPQVLRALGRMKIIISGHSNANPIVGETVLRAPELGIKIERIEMANPLGLRYIPIPIAALCFVISGILTWVASLFVEHPVDLLQGAYVAPKHRNRFGYELGKSSVPRLPGMFQRMREQGMEIPFLVILSSWNWASLHLPFYLSDEKIFRKYIPAHLLKIKCIRGLHNPTLGANSKVLAEVTEKSVIGLSLALALLPQMPVYADWLAKVFT